MKALLQRVASARVEIAGRISGAIDAGLLVLLCAERGDGDAQDCELCRDWEIVYAALRNGPLTVAEQELAAFRAKYPEDGVARYHRGHRS